VSAVDTTGQRFSRLTVIERAGTDKHGNATWLCVCDRGKSTVVRGDLLRSGHTQSCRCLVGEVQVQVHGRARSGAHSRTYKSWISLKRRCTNPNCEKWSRYGGRGITVYDRWLHNYPAFLADMGERPVGHTIHRTDNDGDYEPSNCCWSTDHHEQNANQRAV
jgi:hypothetical protein